jgi:hypothetical protein
MVVWTPELKAKAAATRLLTKQKKEAARLKREVKSFPIEMGSIPKTFSVLQAELREIDSDLQAEVQSVKTIYDSKLIPFDWETCPLNDAINKQAEMKREYDRISAIVLKRQNPNGRRWTCFTEESRLEKSPIVIPKSVLAQCARTGEDGKWKFRDDGRFVTVNGMRTPKPAFCCNAFCFQLYQAYRAQQPR